MKIIACLIFLLCRKYYESLNVQTLSFPELTPPTTVFRVLSIN